MSRGNPPGPDAPVATKTQDDFVITASRRVRLRGQDGWSFTVFRFGQFHRLRVEAFNAEASDYRLLLLTNDGPGKAPRVLAEHRVSRAEPERAVRLQAKQLLEGGEGG